MGCTTCGGLAFGEPRLGQPKTEEERMQTHFQLYGTTDLPPRGTGLRRLANALSGDGKGLIFFLGFFFGAIIGYSWAKPKSAARKIREIREAIRK